MSEYVSLRFTEMIAGEVSHLRLHHPRPEEKASSRQQLIVRGHPSLRASVFAPRHHRQAVEVEGDRNVNGGRPAARVPLRVEEGPLVEGAAGHEGLALAEGPLFIGDFAGEVQAVQDAGHRDL